MKFFTPAQLAEAWGTSTTTIYKKIRSGELGALMVMNGMKTTYRIRLSDVRKYDAAQANAVRDHWVYRYYDVDDRVLYVGCTKQLAYRRAQHKANSDWFQFAVRYILTGPVDRDCAYATERHQIKTLGPVFNLRLCRQSDVSSKDILADYLAEREQVAA